MRRETALKNLARLIEKLKSHGGLIATPCCDHEAVQIRAAWVFGSVAKGSATPNDLDILLDIRPVGRRWQRLDSRHFGKMRAIRSSFPVKPDRHSHRTSKYLTPQQSINRSLIALRDGMKKVSLHLLKIDGEYGDIAETKIMIYPRNDFKEKK